jgi:hypothetical protein
VEVRGKSGGSCQSDFLNSVTTRSIWQYSAQETDEGQKYCTKYGMQNTAQKPLRLWALRAKLTGFFSRPGGSSSIQQRHLASSLTCWMLDEPIFALSGISSSVLHPASSIQHPASSIQHPASTDNRRKSATMIW